MQKSKMDKNLEEKKLEESNDSSNNSSLSESEEESKNRFDYDKNFKDIEDA